MAFLILERSKRVPEEFGRIQSGCHNRRGWVQQGACFLPFSFEGDYEAQCVAKTGDDWLPCHLWCASVLLLEVIPRRMWITYNRAPYDNGHPIGEEVQVVVFRNVTPFHISHVEPEKHAGCRPRRMRSRSRHVPVESLLPYDVVTLRSARVFVTCATRTQWFSTKSKRTTKSLPIPKESLRTCNTNCFTSVCQCFVIRIVATEMKNCINEY